MRKMYNELKDLMPELKYCFSNRLLFDRLEEGDMISFLPIYDSHLAHALVADTNAVLAAYFEVDDPCFADTSCQNKEDNPILFWKDYLGCFYNLELVEEVFDQGDLRGTSFGLYRIVQIAYVDEVNKRFKKRKLNGIRLEYKVKSTPLDKSKHWNRTYDKNF